MWNSAIDTSYFHTKISSLQLPIYNIRVTLEVIETYLLVFVFIFWLFQSNMSGKCAIGSVWT